MTSSPHSWLNTVRTLWDEPSDRSFEKCCERALMYLYTVKASTAKEETLLEDLRDVLFESESAKQVSCYLRSETDSDRMRYYIAIGSKSLSTNVKLKRSVCAKRLE